MAAVACVTIIEHVVSNPRIGVSFAAVPTQRDTALNTATAESQHCAMQGLHSEPAPTVRDATSAAWPGHSNARACATMRDPSSHQRQRTHRNIRQLEALPEPLFSRYRLIKHLSAGAEAELFLAERLSDSEHVVIKWYFSGIAPMQEVIDRVRLLPRYAVLLSHESGVIAGRFFEVVEFAPDGSLRNLLKRGNGQHELIALRILEELASAITAIHAPDLRGSTLVHRDLKPDNIFVRSIEPLDLVVGDFGVSVFAVRDSDTVAGRGFTPAYAAQENLAGHPQISSDYWSIGMILLEMLTGTHPFDGLDEQEVRKRLDSWSPDFAAICGSRWSTLLTGLLERDATNRWGELEVRRWLAEAHDYASESTADISEAGAAEDFTVLQPRSREELAQYLAMQWVAAANLLSGQSISPWLETQLRTHAPELNLAVLLGPAETRADIRLLRLLRRLAAHFPPIWKKWLLEPAGVSEICADAAAGDREMRSLVNELFDLDVLGEIGKAGHEELGRKAAEWKNAVGDFEDGWEIVRQNGGPGDHQPARDEILATLYRATCDGIEVVMDPGYVDPLFMYCCPWFANAVGGRWHDLSPARRLLRSILEQKTKPMFAGNLETHWAYETGAITEARVVHSWGRDPPTVALAALHTEIVLKLCDRHTPIGRRVRLNWSSSKVFWLYLFGHGAAGSNGTMEFSLGETRQFTILAVGPRGVRLCRTAPISVDPILLELPVELDEHRVEMKLLTPAKFDESQEAKLLAPSELDKSMVKTELLTPVELDPPVVLHDSIGRESILVRLRRRLSYN